MFAMNQMSKGKPAGQGRASAAAAGFAAAVVALLGAATQLLLPSVALASESTASIAGTMVVKLQEESAAGAATPASAMTSTGDALAFLVAGIVALMLGALYFAYSSRKLAKSGAHLQAGAHAANPVHGEASAHRKMVVVAVAVVMIACCCFSLFAKQQAAIAAEIVSQTNSTVLVDAEGKVLDSSIVVENAGEDLVSITGVEAPAELQGWTASVAGEAIEPASSAKGTWSGTQVSDDVLQQLKAGNGEVELAYTVSLKCEDDVIYALDFSKFTVDTEGKTYEAAQIKPAVTAEGYTEGVDYTVTYGENFHVGGDAGTITITGIGNYAGEKEYTFNINKKHVTVTGIKAADREYDGTTDVDFDCSEAQVNGLCGDDALTVVAGGELDSASVGERTAKLLSIDLTGENSWDYGIDEWTSIEMKMQVTKRTAELTWYDTSFTYDQQQHCPVAGVSNSIDGEVLVVTVDGAQTAAGTYTATATALDDDNYQLPENATQEFTISPAKVSVSGLSAEDKVYDRTADATLDASQASLDGVMDGDDVALDITNAKCRFDSADAGENKKVTISGLTLSGAAKGNYVFEQEGAQFTTTASISKKAIGVAWTGRGEYTYNGQVQMPSAAAAGEVLGDEVNLTVVPKDGATCKNVGSYTVEATGIDSPNYEFKLGAGTTFSFKIVQKSVQVLDISARNKKYDGTTTAAIDYATATFSGIIEGDKLSVSGGDGTFESAEIGQNISVRLPKYSLDGADAANYYMSNISQNVAYANITEQELDDGFFSSDASDQIYAKTQYKPTVTCSNPDYVEGRDYEVSYDDNTDAGTGYVYVEGIGNYGGLVVFEFEIKPREVDLVWGDDEFFYDGNAHVPTAAADPDDLLDGDAVELSVKTSDGKDAIEIGEYKAEATSQNTNYVASDATATHTFWISEAEYCTVSFSMNGHGDDLDPVTVLKGAKVPEPTDVPTVAGLKFEGWYSQESCLDKWDFDKDTPKYGDYTLYANWVPDTDADVYWISPSSKITTGNSEGTVNQANENYRSEEWCVKKSSEEIRADVAVLQDKNKADYEKVKAEYEAFMANDDFHLYTKWTGDTSDSAGEQAANGYVEFRIIQVGNRDSEEALTFQATHELPTSWQMMQTSNTNEGGWGSSELQAMMNPGGQIYADFNTAFTDDIAISPKKTYAGFGASTPSYSCNYFWLPSYSELSGTRDMHYEEESQQYTYYSAIGVTDSGDNPALMFNTRAGNRPVGAPSEYDTSTPWWTRSSSSQTLTDYKAVNYKGNTTEFSPFSNAYYGVVPCFSFGKRDGNLVTFDMQNHGSQVKYKYVLTGNTVPQPDYEDYGRQKGLKLEGWYTSPTCKPADKWDFSNTVDGNMILYANWVLDEDAKSGNSYWIGTSYKVINQATSSGKGNAANYVSETTNVLKTQEEIRRDVQKIKAGDEATKEYYTQIMNSDAYHLYTKWNGEKTRRSGKEDARLGYVEFRIIQVGSHDGDGSALTFQAIHKLQVGYYMNQVVWGHNTLWNLDTWVPTNQNGWANCDMRAALNKDKNGNAGVILKNFSEGFINDLYGVEKTTTKGWCSQDTQTSTDIMWNLSLNEATGYGAEGYGKEGTQYQYFKNLGFNMDDKKTWSCLMRRTRAWDSVAADYPGADVTGSSGQWWLRSPQLCNYETYHAIAGNGNPMVHCGSDYAYGICPAFCL